MKKIIISISLFLILVIITGCGNENMNLFAKKEKCQEYLSMMEEKVEIERNNQNNPTEPTIFYSPSLDTCIGTYTTITLRTRFFYIYDVLTNENIYFKTSDVNNDGWSDYESKKEELKK